MSNNLSIIIPAAGMGRRMKSYGPKPLVELTPAETVIGRQQNILKKEYPDSEIIVVVGYEADTIVKYLRPDVKSVENENYETTNVVRSLGMALRAVTHDRVLIVYGDLVFNKSAVRITEGRTVAVVDSKGRMTDEEVGVTIVGSRITRFSYDLEKKWGQIVYLTGRELEMFKRVTWNRDYSKWFGFEALNKVIELGGNIRAVEPRRMKIAEIDTSKDIETARFVFG